MSTLNKYAAAARCIRRQRVLKKNAAAYIKLAAEEDTASQEAKKRRRSRLLRGLGIGAGLAGLGGLAYYYRKKHPELTWKSRSDASKEEYIDRVLATPLPGDPKPGNLPPADPKNPVELPEFAARLALDKLGPGYYPISEDTMKNITSFIVDRGVGEFLEAQRDPISHRYMAALRRANDIPGYTFKQRAADMERYSPNNPTTAEERERSERHARDGHAVSTMQRGVYGSDEPPEAASNYATYDRRIDYEGLNTPRYGTGSYFLYPNVDYVPATKFSPVRAWETEAWAAAIRAREDAELEAFKKRYPGQFQ